MAEQVEGADRFEASRVFLRAFHTIGRNFPVFTLIALLFYGVPSFAWQSQFASRLIMPIVSESDVGTMATYLGMSIASLVVGTVLKAVVLAAITHGLVQDASRQRAALGRCLLTGIAWFLPVTALALLCFIGILAGSMLFVVPGLMLWVAWAVVIPVFVEEKPGLLESFGRSVELTRGVRWQIFGILIVVAVSTWIVSSAFGIALALMMAALQLPYLYLGIASVVASLIAMVGAAITASIYVDLRQAREDAPPAELETIFA